MTIIYRFEPELTPEDFIDVLRRSTLPERRPVQDLNTIRAMLTNADEDPVTGSAHCCLANFWSERLGRTKLVAYQASARGGVIHVEVAGDRVLLGGQAIVVAKGELCLS